MLYILGLQFLVLRAVFAHRYAFGDRSNAMLVAGALIEIAVFLAVFRRTVFSGAVALPSREGVRGMQIATLLVVILSVLAAAKAGFPIFAENVNEAKVAASSFPFLTRFFRVGGVYCILWFAFLTNAPGNEETRHHRRFLLVSGLALASSGLLFGFKGYAILMLLPLVFGLSGNRMFSFNLVLFGLLGIGLLIVATLTAEGTDIVGALDFIIARLSDVQMLGADLAIDYREQFGDYWPVLDEARFALLRFAGQRSFFSFQKELFRLFHGSNDLHMEVAVPSEVEYYISSGIPGLLVWLGIFIGAVLLVRRLLRTSRSIYTRAAIVMALLAFLDGALNGIMVFKMLDVLISSVIVGTVVLPASRLILAAASPSEPRVSKVHS